MGEKKTKKNVYMRKDTERKTNRQKTVGQGYPQTKTRTKENTWTKKYMDREFPRWISVRWKYVHKEKCDTEEEMYKQKIYAPKKIQTKFFDMKYID